MKTIKAFLGALALMLFGTPLVGAVTHDTVQYSTTLRNALGDAWETAMGTAIKVSIWSGSQPANCAAASTGSKLAEWTLASDWSAAAASGQRTSLAST